MLVNLVVPDEKEETGVSNYSNELFEQLKNKIEIKKLCFKKLNLKFLNLGQITKNHPILLPKTKQSIIHLPNFFYAIPLIFSKKKTILTIHDLIPSVYPHKSLPAKLAYKLCLYGAKRADRIIVDSENTKKDVQKFLNYPEKRIDVIYLGVNQDKFKPRKDIKKKPFQILYVGSEMPRKNLKVLIKAFAKLKQEIPQAILVKVGKSHWPGARKKLKQLAEELGVLDSIIFKNYVGDVAAEYNQASLFVFPSLYEGFGLPVLEAMACGTPVICSDRTSLPEIAGNAAIYTKGKDADELAEKMFNILTNQKLQKKLIKKGLARAKEFNWKKTAEQTIKSYNKLK